MLSFWERESLLHSEIVIIGAGIAGLSTAISIKEKKPSLSVTILERGVLPYGASTRNAGFTTFGGVGELLRDLKTTSDQEVLALVTKRWEGLHLLRERLGDTRIGYENNGGFELVFRNESINTAELERINTLLRPLFKTEPFVIDTKSNAKFGFNANFLSHAIYTKFEGQLHTGNMMKALAEKASTLGIVIRTGAEVTQIEETNSGVVVHVKNYFDESSLAFQAQKCIVCTNAFTKKFFPEMDITPGRGQVLVTEPIANLPFKGIFHFDEGYYYFRNIGNRILFGGGRNLDFETETSTEMALNGTIQNKLDYYLKHLIIPGVKYKVDLRWSGIMAFGNEKIPIIKQISHSIFAGVRMNGMGVALASSVGRELAEMVLDS